MFVFFFKQKTAYEMRISDWSSDVCSSDLVPHFLAAASMGQVSRGPYADVNLSLAGTGFRDFTRIAAGSPEVWRDIFLSNRAAVLSELDEVDQAIGALRGALEREDGPALDASLDQAGRELGRAVCRER